MGNKLAGNVALITGGNSGIGRATAELFQAEGAKVIITGRRADAVSEAAQALGPNVEGLVSDTADLQDIPRLYQHIRDTYGRLDIVFLNAGIAKFIPLQDVDEAAYDAMMNINVKGLFFNIQSAVPLLTNGGSIILNTSVADQKGFPHSSVYSASKAAVRSFARTLSAELLEHGIRVNAIAPGPIDTPIFEKVGTPPDAVEELKASFEVTVPMKRMGTSDEVAAAALFLASSDSSYVTGIDLTVDGGLTQL